MTTLAVLGCALDVAGSTHSVGIHSAPVQVTPHGVTSVSLSLEGRCGYLDGWGRLGSATIEGGRGTGGGAIGAAVGGWKTIAMSAALAGSATALAIGSEPADGAGSTMAPAGG